MKKDMVYPTVQESINELRGKVFYVPSLMKDMDTYEEFKEFFANMLRGGFEIKELREYPVYFKFKLGEEPHELQLRRFYVNFLMWYPLVPLGKVEYIDESFIVTDFTAKGRKKYMDNQIILKFGESVDLAQLNIVINECIYLLSSIARDFNEIMADSMDMSSYVMLSLKNKQFNDLLNTQIDKDEQPGVVEKMLNDKLQELLSILKTEDNPLKVTLHAGDNIKKKQLIEYFIAVGYKSTTDGKTIPVPISSNFTKGMKTLTEFYAESNSAVKAYLANATKMGDAGAWQKQMVTLCADIKIDHTVKDCRTLKPVRKTIKNQKELNMLHGRYRVGFRGRKIRIDKNDTHLIGQTLLIKSPITCGCDPGYICETCYGDLNRISGSMGVGALAAVKASEKISQSTLSTKHLDTTDSEILSLSNSSTDDDYDKEICELHVNEIYLKKDLDVPLHHYELILEIDKIQKLNSDDDELSLNEYVPDFKIRNIATGECIVTQETKGKELFISPELSSYINANKYAITVDDNYVINLDNLMQYTSEEVDLNDECEDDNDTEDLVDELVTHGETIRLFIIEIRNNELTKPFYDLMNIFSYYVPRTEPTIEWMYDKLFELFINASLDYQPAVFFEIMIKSLVRKASNIYEYANFNTLDGTQDYQITIIKTALSKHPSVLIGLGTTNVDEQLKRAATFEKSETGFLDPFFRH